MFKCKSCGVRFPETKGTVFYNRHLTEEQIIMICKLLVEKNGVRAIERIMEIHRDTVSNLIEDLARHAREVTDYLITNVGLTQIQVDEMWSFVKKQKKVEQGDAKSDRHGDCWIYTAIKSDTKLHLVHCTGKRVQETANALLALVKNRGKAPDMDDKATFVSDGNNQYTKALFENFDVNAINYGQLVKERNNGRVLGKTRTIIFGSLEVDEIETVYVERYNLTLRHWYLKTGQKKSLLLEMQGDVGRSSRSLPVLHQFYPNPFRIEN
jgi:IS1 family transposase